MFFPALPEGIDPKRAMHSSDLYTGARLPNGAIVLTHSVNVRGAGVVLANTGRDFATWTFTDHDPATTSHGHYHGGDLAGAVQDFNVRTANI